VKGARRAPATNEERKRSAFARTGRPLGLTEVRNDARPGENLRDHGEGVVSTTFCARA